jgi:streptogramin lyase
VFQFLPEADGSVLAATAYGLIGWQGGRKLLLNERNGLPCNQINAIVFDDSGNLWMFTNCALGVVTRADLQAWRRDPDARVSLRTFDEFDGVRTGFASFLEAARSPDGRLWFSNSAVSQMVDPTHLHRNAIPPPVHIEQIIVDHKNVARSTGWLAESGLARAHRVVQQIDKHNTTCRTAAFLGYRACGSSSGPSAE